MSVELDPPELGFRRPFKHEVTQILRLENTNAEPVAFKVKTTAPKQYCVRPNSGRIEPGKDVEIQVLLQAMPDDPPLDYRCRDKFLVQSVAISAQQDVGSVASIWSSIEQVAKDSIKERKIRVTFLPAETTQGEQHSGTANGAESSHTERHTEDAPPAYRSPSPTFGSPAQSAASPSFRDTETPSKQTGGSSILDTASSSISAAASATGQTLQQQLDSAKETIAKMRASLEDQGLRQRKTDAVAQDARERISSGTTALGVQTPSAEGVPVQIVAGLCLLSFLLAYFFF